MRRHALLLLVATLAVRSAIAADPFYAGMLRDGNTELERGEYRSAERKLQVACFGLMDEPPLLASGLASLAVARAEVGTTAELAATVVRLADVDERFDALAKAELAPPTRERLAGIVARLQEEKAVDAALAGRLAASIAARGAPAPEPTPTPGQESSTEN